MRKNITFIIVHECKMMWKSLRDKFMRVQRAEKALSTGGAGSKKVKEWKFYETMSFYKQYSYTRR